MPKYLRKRLRSQSTQINKTKVSVSNFKLTALH